MEITAIIANIKKLFQLAKEDSSSKQCKSLVFLEKKINGDSAAVEIETLLLVLSKLKQMLKPSERNNKLITIADNLAHQLDQLKDQSALKAPYFDPAITKPNRQQTNTTTLKLSDTTGRMLEQDYDLQWAQEALQPWSSLVANIEKANRQPFFFGRTAGQRLNRMAYHYVRNAKNCPNAKNLVQAITERGVEKSHWSDVANYWLKSMGVYRDRELLQLQKRELTKEEKLFWGDFNLMQFFLNKDWMEDVDRPDYRHKHTVHATSKPMLASSHRNADIDRDLINRRACKYLLHHMRENDRLIIYSLDGIDQKAVALAAVFTIQQDGKEKTKVPVCTTELRELFRLWDYLGPNVLFTEKLSKVDPPWISNISTQKDWAYYALHLVRKILINEKIDQNFLTSVAMMLKEIKKENYAKVIQLYHNACPSLYGQRILTSKKQNAKIRQNLSIEIDEAQMQSKAYILEITRIILQQEEKWPISAIEDEEEEEEKAKIEYIIHRAARKGDIEVLKTCLVTGIDPDLQDQDAQGDTPLIVAARSGNKECLEWLINYGAQKDLPNHAGHTAVNIAAANGHVNCLKFLIEEAHCAVDLSAQNGATALFVAAWEGHSECVAYLLEKGADANALATEDNDTPLTIAAAEGKIEVLQILLNSGKIKIHHKNRNDQSALSIANEQGYQDCVSLLTRYGAIAESAAENIYQFLPTLSKQPHTAAASSEGSEKSVLHPGPKNN